MEAYFLPLPRTIPAHSVKTKKRATLYIKSSRWWRGGDDHGRDMKGFEDPVCVCVYGARYRRLRNVAKNAEGAAKVGREATSCERGAR